MGIKFNCPACGRPLNVKSELAGKRGRCPKCQAKIDIPTEGATADLPGSPPTDIPNAEPPLTSPEPSGLPGPSVATTPVGSSGGSPADRPSVGSSVAAVEEPTKSFVPTGDPIAEAPTLQWYAMPPGAANQYGPATGEEFRVWMREGRIPADAFVWRQDWPDWKRAGSVFPQLATPAAPTPPAPAVAAAAPTSPAITPMPQPAVAQASIAQAPIAQPAFVPPGAAPGMLPVGQVSAPVADGFPIMPTEPPTTRSTAGRARAYRPRSNTGPIIAIVVLLLAMIPLAYFVWKVVSEQIVSPPTPSATSAAGNSETGDSPPADQDEAASSNESEE